jgi:hypothetical protein
MEAAKIVARHVASDLLKQQVMAQAQAYAVKLMRDAASDAAEKLLRSRMVASMQQAAINRGSLSGVSRIASTVFERADAWAFERMARLHASPLAAVSLHQKLAEQGSANNVFVFDSERIEVLNKLAQTQGLEEAMLALLKGIRPNSLYAEIDTMPLASAADTFRYDDAESRVGAYAQGLVAAMLEMPVAPRAAP